MPRIGLRSIFERPRSRPTEPVRGTSPHTEGVLVLRVTRLAAAVTAAGALTLALAGTAFAGTAAPDLFVNCGVSYTGTSSLSYSGCGDIGVSYPGQGYQYGAPPVCGCQSVSPGQVGVPAPEQPAPPPVSVPAPTAPPVGATEPPPDETPAPPQVPNPPVGAPATGDGSLAAR